MNFFADIPPIKERLMASESVGHILKILATSETRLIRTPSISHIARKMPGSNEGRLCDWVRAMVDNGLVSADIRNDGAGAKNIMLTDDGWKAAGVDKPLWMVDQ